MGLDTDLPKLVDEQKISPGVQLLLHRTTDNPTLAIFGSVQAGAAFEPTGKQGLAELMTRLLIRGTNRLGAAKLADNLESVGAAVSFRNNQDTISFQARTISSWTGRILKIISDCLTSPAFRPGDVEKEREELITDIRLRDDDTTRRGLKELQRILYPPDHPYRHDRLGTAETVKNVERSDLKEYLEERMARGRVVLSLAGMFDKNQVLRWAEKTFGKREEKGLLHNGLAKSGFQPKAENKEIVMAHKTQSDVLIGTSGVARTDSDYETLNLLNTILGELGFMGRLGARVRDKEGLAYSATSFLNAGARGGTWTALAGVNPKNVQRASELIMEELKRVREEPVGGEELDAAKQNQIGSALMELESTEGIARTSHNLAHFGLGLDYFAKRRKFYAAIDPGELQRMGTKYLDPARLATVVVGPRLKITASKS